jgi:hypothetical protein
MPLYSPRPFTAATPAIANVTTQPPANWPPMPQFPAPLSIGYAPHQSPEATRALPLAVRPPPIGLPGGMIQNMAPPFPPPSVQPPLYQPHAPAPNQTRPTVVGYELLADKLSESSKTKHTRSKGIVPMYRKFEHLNHRVLLHMQDELSEMEEELRHLDERIAQTTPRDAEGYEYPASRRGDARYGGEVHFKRTELLGRIFQKIGQYSKAITCLSRTMRSTNIAWPWLLPIALHLLTRYRSGLVFV